MKQVRVSAHEHRIYAGDFQLFYINISTGIYPQNTPVDETAGCFARHSFSPRAVLRNNCINMFDILPAFFYNIAHNHAFICSSDEQIWHDSSGKADKAGPAGGTLGAECLAAHISLNTNHTPAVPGALEEFGLCGRPCRVLDPIN